MRYYEKLMMQDNCLMAKLEANNLRALGIKFKTKLKICIIWTGFLMQKLRM